MLVLIYNNFTLKYFPLVVTRVSLKLVNAVNQHSWGGVVEGVRNNPL